MTENVKVRYQIKNEIFFGLFLLIEDCRNVKCPHETVCLLVKNTGEPFCYPKKHCNAALDPEPVCGTNGITYRNICTMRLSPDIQGRTPELAHKGRCGKNFLKENFHMIY
jgi:hypothetical protein